MGCETLAESLISHSIPVPEAGCWLWTGTTQKWGYGLSCWNKKRVSAHRASFLAFKGEIPEGMFVCHKCDTPSCINPEHLFLGTPLDNTRDMLAKGRNPSMIPKSHCESGHEYTEKNTYRKFRGSRLIKSCRKCNLEANRRYRDKRKQP